MARTGERRKRPPDEEQRGITGISLGVYASTQPRTQVELQMSTSTAAGDFDTVHVWDTLNPNGLHVHNRYIVPATDVHYFRARHIRRNYTASPWTRIIGSTVGTLVPYTAWKHGTMLGTTAAVSYSAGANSTVPWGYEYYDNGNMHSTGDKGHVTVPIGDLYDVSLVLDYSSVNRGSTSPNLGFAIGVRKNDVTFSYGLIAADTTTPLRGTLTLVAQEKFDAGDYVNLNISAPSGGGLGATLEVSTQTRFTVSRVTD